MSVTPHERILSRSNVWFTLSKALRKSIKTAPAGAYEGGCTCTMGEKSSVQKCPKEERKFRPDMSAKKNVYVPLSYDKIKTNQRAL